MKQDPMTPSRRIEILSRAAHPALFETVIDPQLLTVLMLANLMSPSLWQMKDKILGRADADFSTEEKVQQSRITSEMLSYVNRHFTHDFPMGTAEKVGVIELEGERQRLGAEGVNYALDIIRQHFHRRDEQGELSPELDIFPLLEQDRFPIFNYLTIDGLHAMRRLLGHKKHKPFGVTICADEATLMASLANVLHGVSFADIYILGTPAHYTTFLHKNGQRFWCNGKPEYFDQGAWQAMFKAPSALSPQAAFSHRLPFMDRLISPLGTFFISTGECTIPEEELEKFLRESKAFFGCVIEQFHDVQASGISFLPSRVAIADLRTLDSLQSAQQARSLVSGLANAQPLSIFDQAFYCLRDIEVAYPGAYLAAALRGPKLRSLAANVGSLQGALVEVARTKSDEAVLLDRNRAGLPDEVLLFQTGDDVDKGLLLLSILLCASFGSSEDKSNASLLVTDVSTYCCWQDQIIDLKSQCFVAAVSGSKIVEFSQASLYK